MMAGLNGSAIGPNRKMKPMTYYLLMNPSVARPSRLRVGAASRRARVAGARRLPDSPARTPALPPRYCAWLVMALLLGASFTVLAADRKALSATEQTAFLSRRTSGGIMGTLDSYCSLLYAVNDVVLHSEDPTLGKTRLTAPFPDFYRPTWAELFETIARQTKTRWKYDAPRDYWVFAAPPEPPCFQLALAAGWNAHDEGLYIGYRPPTAPVGLDVYMLGRYSVAEEPEKAALFNRVREAIALRFAANFKKDVAAREMDEVNLGRVRVLHFEVPAATGIIWRQWVVVDSGWAFAIVSAIKPEHEKAILPDVLKMVASFKVLSDSGAGGKGADVRGTPPNPSATNRAASAAGPDRSLAH
jgi:hypothetical protein